MRQIDIVIPTRNRLAKLQRCLKSIPKSIEGISINIIVICDADKVTAEALLKTNRIDRITFVRQHSGSVYCRNLVTQTAEDGLLYATDDIKFEDGAIEAAVRAMQEHFPDGDGVVGFNQGNRHHSPAGVALVGQKFLRRYPNRKLFFPGYFHFSCQEIRRLAEKHGRLYVEKEARLIHYHPAHNHEEIDATHADARKRKAGDRNLSRVRDEKQTIWGDNQNEPAK